MDISTSRNNQQTILVVDDHPRNRDICEEILSSEYKVLLAADGQQALDIAFESPPDVILMDLMMPVMDGMTAIKRLKSDPITIDVPIIVMSAKGMTEDIVTGLEVAEDYIVKPFELSELLARVRSMARLKRALDQARGMNFHLEELVQERTEQLLAQGKLSIVGQFAAGIVHNLSGALQKVMASLELAQMDLPDHDKYLRTALDSSLEMREIISTILDKGRNEQRLDRVKLSLNDVITNALSFWEADREFKHNVEKRIDLDPNTPMLVAVHAHWSQSIDNLIKNAIEAMQDCADKLLSISTSYDGTIIKLKVSDTGQGMSKETLESLFNPFYSTKVDGGGTGLGLASLKALMEPYGVKISVESEPGKGSDFCLAINPLLVNAGYQENPPAGEPQGLPAPAQPLQH